MKIIEKYYALIPQSHKKPYIFFSYTKKNNKLTKCGITCFLLKIKYNQKSFIHHATHQSYDEVIYESNKKLNINNMEFFPTQYSETIRFESYKYEEHLAHLTKVINTNKYKMISITKDDYFISVL